MKKSLSLITAIALVFSLFSSVAFAADSSSSLSTADKFNQLKAEGIFTGTGDGDGMQLDLKMNRGSAAVIVARLAYNGDANVPAAPATPTFSDVDSSQAWFKYVEAAASKGIIVGNGDGTFDPGATVTFEQLAVMLSKAYANATGTKVDTTATTSADVDAWAAPYVKAATDLGLFGDVTDWKGDATRGDLVNVTFNTNDQIAAAKAPAKVSVTAAKAVGVQKVEVDLNKAVDTTKATFTVKRDTSAVTVDNTSWSDDNKTATLTIDSKIIAGNYTVTLGGLTADEIDTASATFTGEDEMVKQIEFTNASDEIAVSDKAKVPFRALNQYGEDASFSAGNYTAYASTADGSALVSKDSNTGKLYVTLDTNDSSLVPNVATITVNIYSEDSHVNANKTFKLGTQPYVAKVELGDVQYPTGKTALSADGDKAIIPVTQYDQYGGIIDNNSGAIAEATFSTTPYNADLDTQFKDDNGDGTKEIVVSLTAKPTVNQDYTVTVYGGSSVETKTVSVKTSKVPYKVQVGQPDGAFAVGDTDKYIPIIAYDADGNQLSAQDIADNADLLTVNVSGNLSIGSDSNVPGSILDSNGVIVTQGEHAGEIHIKSVDAKGIANVFVGLYNGTVNSTDSKTINIQDRRYPVSLKTTTVPATEAVASGTSDWVVKVYDQYGEELSSNLSGVTYTQNNKSVTYDVYAYATSSTGSTVNLSDGTRTITAGAAAGSGGDFHTADLSKIDGVTYTFHTAGAAVNDKLAVKFAIRKLDASDNSVIDDNVSSVSSTISVIDPSNVTLTYSVGDIDNLFAAQDYFGTGTEYSDATKTLEARSPSLSAKDSAGNTVVVPNTIFAVTSSNPKVVAIGSNNTSIIGNTAGTANINVNFTTANGDINSVTKAVTVKNDPVTVASLSADASDTATTATIDAADLMNLVVKDQYNTEYDGNDPITLNSKTSSEVKAYKNVLGITYAITDVKYKTGGAGAQNQVTLDNTDYQTLIIGDHVTSFTLTALSPSGKTATTSIITNN